MIDIYIGKVHLTPWNAANFRKGTANAPEGASVLAFFSLTGFLHWAGQSNVPGTAQLKEVQPTDGIAAWITPNDGALSIFLRLPAGEFVTLRKAFLGDTAILNLLMR